MRKIVLLLTFALSAHMLSSQNDEWASYDLDSLVSVELPNKVITLDTLIRNIKLYQIYSYTENATFIVQKTALENENKDGNLSKLPYDLASLKKQYDGIISGIVRSIPYQLDSKELIERQNFKGYKLIFKDSLNTPTYEGELYLLNKHLYCFYYSGLEHFDTKERDQFFNAIQIHTDKTISQYLGKPQGYRAGYVLGKYIFYVLIFGIIIYFTTKKKKKKQTA